MLSNPKEEQRATGKPGAVQLFGAEDSGEEKLRKLLVANPADFQAFLRSEASTAPPSQIH